MNPNENMDKLLERKQRLDAEVIKLQERLDVAKGNLRDTIAKIAVLQKAKK